MHFQRVTVCRCYDMILACMLACSLMSDIMLRTGVMYPTLDFHESCFCVVCLHDVRVCVLDGLATACLPDDRG